MPREPCRSTPPQTYRFPAPVRFFVTNDLPTDAAAMRLHDVFGR